MRTARKARGSSRSGIATTARGGALAVLALAGAIGLGACTTPEPESTPDPVDTSSAALREQLLQIEGLSDPGQTLSGLEYELQFAIDDPDRAAEATREALDAFHASGVPEALTADVAEFYDSPPRFQLSIVEVGSEGVGPHLDLPIASEDDTPTLAAAVATWSRMGQIEGIRLQTSTFDTSTFEMGYTVDFEGLLAGVRPTAVTPQLRQILADAGYDPAASTIKAAITAPEASNTVGGKEKYVQGTRFARASLPLKAVAGPNFASVSYFIPPGGKTVDIYVLPKLGADGTLLPLDLTDETVRTAGESIQTGNFDSSWDLRDVIVFTQDGMQTFPTDA
ncbi:hypothetical protein SAMN06295879_2102 [Agreia bicolorata]|uniref:Uncharacterized protein n=1 Tax=Agreia bicolorata TaxID=110935 RepID=A0A1T4Y237_9MICO|nr:hypothetical protein [Agreia bicolorata]SKA95852.1 hypothetical protein SAMN06295879_2102 [Agreia bicolorata]